MNKTCKDCIHFIGAGDWNLCCELSHEGYPFGFLCYEDTPACDKFSPKIKTLNFDALKDRMIQGPSTEEALKDVDSFYEDDVVECDGRCLNCDYYGTYDCPDNA